MDINTMTEQELKDFFKEGFEALEKFRLMFPVEWRNNMTGDVVHKYFTAVEVYPKIDSFTDIEVLRALVLHVNDTLLWARAVTNVAATPPMDAST